MNYNHFTVEELQRHSISGDEEAMKALGERVMWLSLVDDLDHECRFRDELEQVEQDMTVPPDCPHCGKWLTNK